MKAGVVIPVGPGHEGPAEYAIESVHKAWRTERGPFTELAVTPVLDLDGQLGRSDARNRGLDETPADWHFLMDADDRMLPEAFGRIDLDAPATFGAIMLDGRIAKGNRYPVTRETLFRRGARGTLCMGCFVRGDLGLRFDESLDIGEDFDFYMRLPGFVKLREPLVDIGYRQASQTAAHRPWTDWQRRCEAIIDSYREDREAS